MASSAFRTLLEHELDRMNARSIISITTLMIADAHAQRASDIHIDPYYSNTQIRLRIDGLLQDSYFIPASCHAELIARLKILSRLRTDEHFVPRDGGFRFALPNDGLSFDIRLSIVPTQYGESAVLRLLVPLENGDSLGKLGMDCEQENIVLEMLRGAQGMVLIVGPTGSGKTTTLYALIQQLIGTHRSIVSIEDPIEYSIHGIRQMQVVPHHGLTFAEGLRAILRQDPDIIVLGEMRDAETANLAVNAAHTGHLVISTLHATNAAGARARLEELGVGARRLDSIRTLVIAQSLVKKIETNGRQAEFELRHA